MIEILFYTNSNYYTIFVFGTLPDFVKRFSYAYQEPDSDQNLFPDGYEF